MSYNLANNRRLYLVCSISETLSRKFNRPILFMHSTRSITTLIMPNRLYLLGLLLLAPVLLTAQQIVVDSIIVEGNNRTLKATMTREMTFDEGDTLALEGLEDVLEYNRRRLMGTQLFVSVRVNIKRWDMETNRIKILIEVQEAWYIYPLPIFDLADRNYNVWINEFGASLSRVSYGLRLKRENTTGRDDELNLIAQFGYTTKFEVDYDRPFFVSSSRWGGRFNALYTRQREVQLVTLGNQQIFYQTEDEDIVLERLRFFGEAVWRPDLFDFHSFRISYFRRRTNERVAGINYDFFGERRTEQQFVGLRYQYLRDLRDRVSYAMSGYYASAILEKSGIGIFDDLDRLDLTLNYGQFFSWDEDRRWSSSHIFGGKVALQRTQPPFYNNRALGYELDFLRGFELSVIDGQDFAYLRQTIRYRAFRYNLQMPRWLPTAFRQVPFTFYLTAHGDVGYVNEEFYDFLNPYTNEMLAGYGGGLNIVFYNDLVNVIEVSRNNFGELGLYYRFRQEF